MSHPPTVMALHNVTRQLKETAETITLVKDVSFNLNVGEFVAVTGASGSGKSSLMYLMGLLDLPTHGRLELLGHDVALVSAQQRDLWRLQHIGFVFQFHFLLPEFSALDNIMLPMRKLAKLTAPAMRERANHLLEIFSLSHAADKFPGQMSGGERQRVAIARAVANDPLLLLADEPSGNLDSKNAKLVFDLFARLAREENKTVVVITHDDHLAQQTDRILMLRDGELMRNGV
ncbi:MAG: ABC transporter ATP-binding protein [Holosporales bacterium]